MKRAVLVTGGNAGIGFALCRQLAAEHNCTVYMGARNAERGKLAIAKIKDAHPKADVKLTIMDVSSDESVSAAAKTLSDIKLYAVVNNAGVGLGSAASVGQLIETNLFGPKRVTEAFVSNLDKKEGRVVNVSSGVAAMWLRDKSDAIKNMFTNADTTWDELKSVVAKLAPTSSRGGYGISKAALNCLTLQQAKKWPNLTITALTPGFINTRMTKGYGAKLTPEQGTVSMIKCLFGKVTSSHYYGSDGLRSPLTVTRDPGMPEYGGESNPDPRKYNR